MPFYEITNNIFGDAVKAIFGTSTISEDLKKFGRLVTLEHVDLSECLSSINIRFPMYSTAFTLAIGNPDFLPFSFLERGLRCGAAVCRLVRRFTVSKLVEVLKPRKYTVGEIREILKPLAEKIRLDATNWKDDEAVATVLDTESVQAAIQAHKDEHVTVPVATGFLVGRNYLLTNCHVIPDKALLSQFTAQFQYQRGSVDDDPSPVEYGLDETVWIANPQLDYVLVKVKALVKDSKNKYPFGVAFPEAGDTFGWLPMYADPNVVAPPLPKEKAHEIAACLDAGIRDRACLFGWQGDAVNVIQHPRGRAKEIVLYDSRVKEIYTDLLEYVTDVEPGTSGSPVFNAQWQLAALHHSVLLDVDESDSAKKPAIAPSFLAGAFKFLGRTRTVTAKAERPAIVLSCLGTRISRIVQDLQDLKDKPENVDAQTFFNDFVIELGEIPDRGRIFLFAGRKRDIPIDQELEAEWMQDVRQKIVSHFPQQGFELIPVPTDRSDDEAIQWINGQDYKAGDIALDIRMNLVKGESDTKADMRGISALYVGVNAERKAHADILLRSLLKAVPEVPGSPGLLDRGARSDYSESPNGVPFCREVLMPSLVLYLGFLTSPVDRNVVDTRRQEIATGITQGLIRWANTLSPIPV